jgi:seryl-tRNA synthetase
LGGQCSFIKASGERCRGTATGPQGLCFAHDPANADKRRRTASRGGRGKANREIVSLKEEIKSVIADVRAGDLDRNDAAVMIQGYRALKDFIALERQVKETDELAAEIEELKREYDGAA